MNGAAIEKDSPAVAMTEQGIWTPALPQPALPEQSLPEQSLRRQTSLSLGKAWAGLRRFGYATFSCFLLIQGGLGVAMRSYLAWYPLAAWRELDAIGMGR
ncbi:MAG: hypothetical protein MK135_10045 [Polyangiaceae bacterium]|nr:hypothetical protein [Polyangiaceae bacterium]